MAFKRRIGVAVLAAFLVALLAFPLVAQGGDGSSYTTGRTEKIHGIIAKINRHEQTLMEQLALEQTEF